MGDFRELIAPERVHFVSDIDQVVGRWWLGLGSTDDGPADVAMSQLAKSSNVPDDVCALLVDFDAQVRSLAETRGEPARLWPIPHKESGLTRNVISSLSYRLQSARPLLVVADIVALLSKGDNDVRVRVRRSIKHYECAIAWYLSLRHWRHDYRTGHPSPLLEFVPRGRTSPLRAESEDTCAKLIFFAGPAEKAMRCALAELELARLAGDTLRHWSGHVAGMERAMEQALHDLTEASEAKLAVPVAPPVTLPRCRSDESWNTIGLAALQWLVHECQKGYPEGRHRMTVRHCGPERRIKHYSCDLFQRAVFADALLDARIFAGDALNELIEFEAEYVACTRAPDGMVGWSYCPEMPNLPPDSDDLGQVLQLLMRTNRKGIADRFARPAVELLFEQCSHPDGSFDTWIVQRMPLTESSRAQLEFVARQGPVGPSPEVMANLLYGLALFEPVQYADELQKGIDVLLARQAALGYWHSHWYAGPFYGTYTVLRLLRHLRPDPALVERTCRYVTGTQRGDGSWPDTQGIADPLQTALGALCLVELDRIEPVERVRDRLAAAAIYLDEVRARHDGWPAVVWLSTPHGTRTSTTAYVLKAAAAVTAQARGETEYLHYPPRSDS